MAKGNENPASAPSGAEGRITTERRGPLLLIGIDRPAKLNAFTPEMMAALSAAYSELDDDPGLRCGVLFAHGGNFTAGIELDRFVARMGAGEGLLPEGTVDPFGLRPPLRVKPVVVAVCGWCLTLGIELLLAADVTVAAADTRFRQHEVARGIMAAAGATIRMVERAGWGNAMRYLLTGDEFGADEALRLGFVQEVTAPGEELDRALEIAATIARQAPLAVAATRASALKALTDGREAAAADFGPSQRRLLASADSAEGLRAFLERRVGAFEGR
jgi:enoyl-CoA hydratase/carnithine racemase